MKILLIIGHEGIYSGASYQALYLALGLRDRGHEVHCIWGPQTGDPSLQVVSQAGLVLRTLDMKRKANWRAIRQLRHLLKEENFDVVHCFKGIAMYRVLGAARGLKIPALVFNREVSKPLEYFQGAKYRSRKVDLVIADSEAVRKVLIKSGRLQPEKVRVVYDEVDLNRYHPGVDGSAVRREFNIGATDFFCGVIGNYAAWRGQEYFLQAIARIRKTETAFSQLKFILIGRGTDSLSAMGRKLGLGDSLFFTGFRTDLEEVVAALDLVVNCSVGVESLSGAITIAMAAGKPVVATAIAGTPELVEEGATGLLVPPRDPEALAQAIMRMASLNSSARRSLGEKARRKMEENFSRQRRAQRMEALYREIIAKKSGVAAPLTEPVI